MKLTKFEQSGWIIETTNGFRLAIDIASKTPVEKLSGISVDAMIISHIHGDHFSLDQIRSLAPRQLYLNAECISVLGEVTLPSEIISIKSGNTITVDSIAVQIFDVDHGPNVSSPISENFGFLITADDTTIYFAGDMFNPSGINITDTMIDYALIPVGGFYTFDPQSAYDFVSKCKHITTVIPMHYDSKPAMCDEFVALCTAGGIAVNTWSN